MATIEQLTQERDRLMVRAKELQRQRAILQNELDASGASEAERDYIRQRIKTLSDDEDQLTQKLAKVEPQITQQRTQEELSVTGRTSSPRLSAGSQVTVKPQQLQAVVRANRTTQEHEERYASFTNQIRKSATALIIGALIVAGVADILSVFDIGWIVSWLIPIIGWFMVRRVTAIRKTAQDIVAAQQEAVNQVRLTRQRLGMPNRDDLPSPQGSLSSYVTTFVITQIITQGLELVPVLDWLPMYIGSVVKIIFDQHRSYRTAQNALADYRQTIDILAQLEQAE